MRNLFLLSALTAAFVACGGEPAASPAEGGGAALSASIDLPPVLVHKTATCGCCNGWIDHLREAGFDVEARDTRTLHTLKADVGVPAQLASCHTAIIDGYVVEGHVPAYVIRQLLEERPEVTGISVPGMPIGSPGMEGPNPQPYSVYAFDRGGRAEVFAEVDPR